MRWISPPENPTTTSPVVKTPSTRSQDMTTEPHGTQQVLVEHRLRPHRVEHHVASSLPLTRHALPHITRLDLLFERRRRHRVHHSELPRRILRPQQALQEPLLLLSPNHAHRLPLILATTEYGVMTRQTQLCRRQTRPARRARHRHHLVSRHASSHLQAQGSRTVVDAQNGHRLQRHGLQLIHINVLSPSAPRSIATRPPRTPPRTHHSQRRYSTRGRPSTPICSRNTRSQPRSLPVPA